METLNGRDQEDHRRGKKQAMDMGSSNPNHSHWRFLWLVAPIFLSGCAAVKKAAIVSSVSSLGAGVGSVLSGSVGAAVGAATGATAGVLATGLGQSEKVTGQPLEVTAETVVQEAPSNFFDLLEQLVSMGGWLLILIFVVPMILGWIIPGPLKMHKRKKKR
jgi:hypothetical protein